ncbi:alpha/beta fold hydrolase [Nonomuraea sp. NPDC046802]|uniref:alpha/beta fold hydrolase n=1 Tax=Nonomuraea sp. NPDC046802 TaxID=3154919 RepID=UPI0033C4E9F8
MKRTIIAVLGAGLLCATAAHPAAAQEGLSWRDCGDGLQCSRITVPADWAAPGGERIELGLAMLPARDPAAKKGTLLLNMGGPAQQISVIRQAKSLIADLTQWFDVVVSDPRGFEASTAIVCPDPQPVPGKTGWILPDRADYDAFTALSRRFGARCAKAAGPLADKLNSWQVAGDMEAIRVALGEPKLNYFGNSYGTVVGRAYAERFPHRVGRMYLDSVIDQTNPSWESWLLPRAKTKERSLHRFAEWCATDKSCALNGRNVLKVWDEVMARAAKRPIPAPGAGPGATADASLIASRVSVNYEPSWPKLAASLAEAHAGDATQFAKFPDVVPDPSLSRIVMCADFPSPTAHDEVMSLEKRLRSVAPRIGWTHAWPRAVQCSGLPKATTIRPREDRLRLPPALIVSGEYDDAAPPADGRRIAAQLKGSRFVPVKGGHALYLYGHPCVREHVHRYLTTGKLPAEGTTCGPA